MSTPLRVLQVSKFYPPHHGGIEAVARDLSAGLAARGVQVAVLCAHKRPRQAQEVDAAGVPVTRAANYGMLLSTSMAPGLLRLLRQRRDAADIVHVHMPDPLAALAVWWARPRGRVVLQWHSDVVRQRLSMALYAPLQDWLLRRADAVIASSAAYAESSVPLRPWQHKVAVIPIGTAAPQPVTPARVQETRARYGGRRIVFVLGRLTYYKGHEVLLRAAPLLPPDVVVVVAGGGPDLAHWRARALSAGVADRVQFVGPLSATRVESHFAAAHLFCLASTVRAEAYGVVVAEAMARSLAVVATRIPGSGLNWLHEDGVTGLAVPPGDAPALAQALNTLLADDDMRQRCAADARRRWEQVLCAQTMCDTMLALYRRLAGPAPAEPSPLTSSHETAD
jgi:rhamnosyl/mannosyltransferase